MLEPAEFAHLHVHSEYSLLDGACRLKQLAAQAKAMGQTAVAVTDHGNLYAAVLFYDAALEAGIKPIIGCEVYVAQRTRFDQDALLDGKSYHLVLLCENNTGYQNLMQLVSLANLEGFYRKPRIDFALLEQYHEGLICLSACLAGEIPRKLLDGDYQGAKDTAIRYRDLFGRDNYFLEMQDHGLPEDREVTAALQRLSLETGIPLVATNDAHYLTRQDAAMQKALLAIQTGTLMNAPNGMGFSTNEFYLKSTEEMAELFPHLPEAIRNAGRIAARCNVTFTFGERKLPQFVQEGITDNTAYLRGLCVRGMRKRYGDSPSAEVQERLKYELGVIERMGFVDYFLIVWDFIRYAKSRGIPVGPGRGSGAGSLCAYCMGITNVDPIAEQLLFERFLNPERVSMPDFDIDFCVEGRQAIRDYITQRYGEDHVTAIIEFDNFKARAAVRDLGRVMELPYALCDKTAKLIDSRLSLKDAIEQTAELKTLYQNDEQVRKLLDMAMQIEGMPRHVTTHPAGVVIAGRPVGEYVPLQKNGDMVVTQYCAEELERLGLLKMDLLGLRNLTIIRDCVQSIRRTVPDFSEETIPVDDPAVFQLLSSGRTAGVFQLESAGMRQLVMRLKPQDLEDIIAVLALYRPGPMDAIPTYIHNRRHPEDIHYAHPLLQEILEVSYGCLLYQEQVMQVFRTLAGYSYGRADLVRRAMSKKKQSAMEQERQYFLYGSGEDDGCVGAVANGVPLDVAEQLFSQMESFASYAFNKSHAAAYGLLAYRTAYLKCHYFADYMAALMTSVTSEAPKLLAYMEECREAGLTIAPPDVNTGEWSFTWRENRMMYGLLAIRNLGKGLIDKMTAEREKHGKFRGFVDFCRRTSPLGMNKRALEALVQAGALDCFEYNRRQMLLFAETVLDAVHDAAEQELEGQMSLFGDAEQQTSDDIRIPSMPDFPLMERLQMEKEVTGMYLSGHPIDAVRYLEKLLHCQKVGLMTMEGNTPKDGTPVSFLCVMQGIKKHRTKKGDEMCFFTAEDTGGSVDCIVFPKLYEVSRTRLVPDRIALVTGKISVKDDAFSVLCDSIHVEADVPMLLAQRQLCLKLSHADLEQLPAFEQLCSQHPGNTEVLYYLVEEKKYVLPKKKWAVGITDAFYQALCQIFPQDRIGCIPKIRSKS